jgi:hypothetical protein
MPTMPWSIARVFPGIRRSDADQRSLSDPGLTWADDSHARQTSTWGSWVPLKMRRSLPKDCWNDPQDCVEAAE